MSKLVEEWRDIEGFEGLYQVSDWGRVKSLGKKKERLLKFYHNTKDYLAVDLHKNGYIRKCNVHRLVAEAFIPNPENKPCVCHNDCNPSNNTVENLYWGTYSENNNHPITKERQKNKIISEETKKKMSEGQKKRFKNGKHPMSGVHVSEETKNKISEKNSKQVYQYTLDGKLIGVFKNSVIASIETGFPQAQISKYANGKFYSKQRNKWYFKNEYKGYLWSLIPL